MRVLFVITIFSLISGIYSIGCYVCSSTNGSQPLCHDPFNATYPNTTKSFYQPNCKTGRKYRDGLFPASVCVKVKGKYLDSSESILIRGCAVDSNTLTMDTEIARIPHSCGFFDFVEDAKNDHPDLEEENVRRVYGCIDVCDSVDGCNGSDQLHKSHMFTTTILLSSVLYRTI